MKKCKACGVNKPIEQFPQHGRAKAGHVVYRNFCKPCHKQRKKKAFVCVRCGEEKPRGEFCGNFQHCKACIEELKKRECEKCGEKKGPEAFARFARICDECKAWVPTPKAPRIKSIGVGGETYKVCGKCERWKPLKAFYNSSRNGDGKTTCCKACVYREPEWKGRTKYAEYDPALLRKAESKWDGMRERCRTEPCYNHVEVKMKREAFVRWVIPELERFYQESPYEVASIDRIDPAGNYEFGNIQIISHRENSLKAARQRREAQALLGPLAQDAV